MIIASQLPAIATAITEIAASTPARQVRIIASPLRSGSAAA
jgi:hypothetical protein